MVWALDWVPGLGLRLGLCLVTSLARGPSPGDDTLLGPGGACCVICLCKLCVFEVGSCA